MTSTPNAARIRGAVINLTWTDGPTKGKTYRHTFHPDGTVEYRDVTPDGTATAQPVAEKPAAPPERPKYAAFEVTPEVYAASYLGSSGYTLTFILNFQNKKLAGFASGAKEWYPVQGTFEVVS